MIHLLKAKGSSVQAQAARLVQAQSSDWPTGPKGGNSETAHQGYLESLRNLYSAGAFTDRMKDVFELALPLGEQRSRSCSDD